MISKVQNFQGVGREGGIKVKQEIRLAIKHLERLTVKGLGADLAVRPGHSAAMTRGGGGVTLRALHLLPFTSESSALPRLIKTSP